MTQALKHLAHLAALLTLLGAAGCSHRIALDRARFERKIAVSAANASRIRVYLNHRLDVTYKVPRNGASRVSSDIHLLGRRRIVHEVIRSGARGKLIGVAERDGRPVLHVAFDDACDDLGCAYTFVAQEDGRRFSLAAVPDRPPATLRVSARDRGLRRRLSLGYLRHLGEPAMVFRGLRKRRGPLTVDLEVVEHWQPTRTRWRRLPGVGRERDDDAPRDLSIQRPRPQ